MESYVFSAVIGVFAGLTSASVRVKGFAFAVREGCRELTSEVGRVSERTRFKRSSRSIRARSRAHRSIALEGDGFFRLENTMFSKHVPSCVLFDMQSGYPLGRLVILSDNLALVLALRSGRSNNFSWHSVMRRIFASGFRAGFVLSFRWIQSELNCSDKGSRFSDRDYDPSK